MITFKDRLEFHNKNEKDSSAMAANMIKSNMAFFWNALFTYVLFSVCWWKNLWHIIIDNDKHFPFENLQ